MTPSDRSGLEAELHRIGAILESVAARFPPESKEALAIRDAALAYQIVQTQKVLRELYRNLHFDREITDVEMDGLNAKLRAYGIDPDDLNVDLREPETDADQNSN